VVVGVREAYWGLLRAKRNRDVAGEVVGQYGQHLSRAKGFFEVGLKPKFDVTKAEVDLSNAKLNLLKAENALRLAQVALSNAMGLPGAPDYEILDSLAFLRVNVDLEQALKHIDPGDPAHKGVQVVYNGVMRLLMRQGVERIAAEGQLFDPHTQEAVAVMPAHEAGVQDMHVVAVTQPGYLYAERVLRPAKVIVAKQGA